MSAPISEELQAIAALLRKAADTHQSEQEKVAADREELDALRRSNTVTSIAKTAAENGFIDEDQVEAYAETLADSETDDLQSLLHKVASGAPRVRLGTAEESSPVFSSTGIGEDSLVSRLTRNA
jgi:hypothetical protein